MAVARLFPARSGLMGFCLSVWGPSSFCLQRDSCWLVLSLAQRYVAVCCLSFDVLGGSLVRFRGWCWFCGCGGRFSFRNPLLLSSTSQGCVPFPVCHGECSGEGVRVSSPQGCGEACVFLSRLFLPQFGLCRGVRFVEFVFLLLPGSCCWIGRSLLGLLWCFFLRFVFRSVCLSP